MEMDIVVNRITRDLKMSGLISEDFTEDVKFFIRLAWVSGWETGKNQIGGHRKRSVVQCDQEGRIVNAFDSLVIASKETKFGESTIKRSLRNGTTTKAGYVFKYTDVG